jgi:hypothetical protein
MHNGLFYCLDLNGNIQWSIDLNEGDPIPGSAAVADGYIYVMDWDGYVNKIDMMGNVVLRFYTDRSGDSFWSSFWGVRSYTPTVVGDKVWIGGTNNRVRCYNGTDGELIFEGYQPNVAGETSHGSAVYIPNYAMNPLYENGTDADCEAGYICTQAGPTLSLSRADTGENIWSNWGGWEVWSTPVFSGIGRSSVIYYGSDSAGLTVVDATTGTALSWYTARGNIVSSPAVWDGKLYVGSYDGKMYCFEDRNTQEMAASCSVDKTSVNLGDSVTVSMQLTKTPDVNVYEEIGRPAPTPGMPDASVLITFTDPSGVEHDTTATTDENGFASASYTPDATGTWSVIAWYNGEELPAKSYSYAFSDTVTISVSEETGPAPAVIATVSPTASDIMVGESVVLTASTSGGTAPFTYQWYTYISGNAVAISGETAATLVVAPDSEGTYGYYCEVSDAAGMVDSSDTAEVKAAAETTTNGEGIPMEYIYAIIAVIAIVVVLVVVYMVMKKRE